MLSTVRNRAVLSGVGLLQLATCAWAQGFVDEHISPVTLQVLRVEEDWELQVGDPDPNVTAPQVTTAISPANDLSGVYAIFNLNHQALDEFAPGGMQLQVWNGETPVSHYRLHPQEVLSDSDELVQWTQVMELTNNGLVFRIENGHSQTWGDFGGSSLLTERVATTLSNLNGYNPQQSVDNSGTVFAANRVRSLVLKRVRVDTSDGQQFEIPLNLSVESVQE